MSTALVAVQLAVDAGVLATPAAYRAHVEGAVTAAVAAAGPADARLVVVPELAGHLALFALALAQAHTARTLAAALAASAVRRPLEVLRGVAQARTLAPRHAVLAALAPDAERFWRGVFGPLARRLGAYIVAGSHLRLAPDGDLLNASLLFGPDGRCLATTDKVNLVPGVEDGGPRGLGLARGAAERLPIVDTALGRVCTLISYDGFRGPRTTTERFTPLAERLAARGGVAVVANPAANPWRWPADAWRADGLAASLAHVPFARYGVTAQLAGELLDLRFDGASEIVVRDPDAGVRALARVADHDGGGHVTATVPS